MTAEPIARVPVYCYQCVAGPDLLKVVVKDGVAVGVEPNHDLAEIHPAGGKVCVRAYGLIQKLYNPARVPGPMRRTNPRKGRDQDPGWEPISWSAALELLAERLNRLRAKGLTDEAGYPRLAVTFGSGGAGLMAPFLLTGAAATWAQVAAPALALAGILMMLGQLHAKARLILVAGRLRPGTLAGIRITRRPR